MLKIGSRVFLLVEDSLVIPDRVRVVDLGLDLSSCSHDEGYY